jgi:hypothetical protein
MIYLCNSSGGVLHEITRQFGQKSTDPNFSLLSCLACVLRTCVAIPKVLKQTILQGPFFTRPQPIDDAIGQQLLAQALNPSGFKIPLDEAKFEVGTRLVKTYTESLAAAQGMVGSFDQTHRNLCPPLDRQHAAYQPLDSECL